MGDTNGGTLDGGNVGTGLKSGIVIREATRPGDLGWVIGAHGELYDREYGWDQSFEALVARIVADYAADHDPTREHAFIAELDGVRVGCSFVVAGGDDAGRRVAKLRLVLVDPAARGHGLGRRLVAHAVDRARGRLRPDGPVDERRPRRGRHVYEGLGFVLVDAEPHHSFGIDLVGQNWALDLR